jgi:hypothetical protein
MDTNINEPQVVTNQPEEVSPKKSPNRVMGVIGIIAFIILVIAVNATAVYFGAKNNSANAPLENPVTMPGDNSGGIPAGELNTLPPNTIEMSPGAVLDTTVPPETLPSDIAPELPATEGIPNNTASTP